MAVGATPPPPGPEGEVSWRDRYLDADRLDLYTPAGRALGRIGEDPLFPTLPTAVEAFRQWQAEQE